MNAFRNLIKLRSTNLQKIRHYGINLADTIPSYFSQRERLLNELLKNHDFNDKQQSNIREFVVQNQIQLTDQDLFRIDNAVNFWKEWIVEKPEFDKQTNELIDHLYVLSQIEPSLLFIDCEQMKKRVNLVQKSGFCDGKNDVATLFTKAPKAYFLQEWPDVILKAYYIQHRVLDWILNKKPTCLYPHPIIVHPNVLELDYHDIKTRFLFAINSGYKSKGLFQELSKATPYDTFGELLAIDLDLYFRRVCKGLSDEEYLVYKEMIKLQDVEEDRMFRELSYLNDSISTPY